MKGSKAGTEDKREKGEEQGPSLRVPEYPGKEPKGQGLFWVRAFGHLPTSRGIGPFRIKVLWGKSQGEEGSVRDGVRA